MWVHILREVLVIYKDDIEKKRKRPKDALKEMWEMTNSGPYEDVYTAISISKKVSAHHLRKYPEMENLINSIND